MIIQGPYQGLAISTKLFDMVFIENRLALAKCTELFILQEHYESFLWNSQSFHALTVRSVVNFSAVSHLKFFWQKLEVGQGQKRWIWDTRNVFARNIFRNSKLLSVLFWTGSGKVESPWLQHCPEWFEGLCIDQTGIR